MLVAVSHVDAIALEEERMVMQSPYEVDGNNYGYACNRSQETDIRTYLDRSMIVFLSRRCAEVEELRRI